MSDFWNVNITDTLMVIVTIIYVIATALICYFNWKSSNTTKELIEENIRPYISVDLSKEKYYYIQFKNTGKRTASNVNIKINQEFLEQTRGKYNPSDVFESRNGEQSIEPYLYSEDLQFIQADLKKLSESHFDLAVNKTRKCLICIHWEIYHMDNKILILDISYNHNGKTYEEKNIILDLSQLYWENNPI